MENIPDSKTQQVFGDETTGYILSHTPPIVERVLDHLPLPILNKCACVCRLWNSVVQAIKRRRTDIFWMFKVHAAKQDNHVVPSDPTHVVFATKESQDVGLHFHETLKTALSEPKLGIMFFVDRITEKPKKYFKDYMCSIGDSGHKKERKIGRASSPVYDLSASMSYHEPLMDYISKHLPRQCSLISCCASGIVGTPVDRSGPIELEQSIGFTSLFFPSIPGLETYTFSITSIDLAHTTSDDDAIQYLTGIPKDKEVKCLLLFLDNIPDQHDLTFSILENYMKKQNYHIALGGAIVDTVDSPSKHGDDGKPAAVGVAFVGENVRAASIVLEPSIRKEQQVLQKLNQLKTCSNFGENNCVAFMFACCSRGTGFYKRPNVEANTFRKVFPRVPLFGLFGNGEIGNNYFPNNSSKEKDPSYMDSSRPHWFHGYTTIFILLSWSKN